MTVGNLVALHQRSAVRLLAWSSVAQSGYMLVPFAGAGVDVEEAVAATVAYVIAYAVMNLGAFSVVTLVGRHRPAELPRRLPRPRPHRAAHRRRAGLRPGLPRGAAARAARASSRRSSSSRRRSAGERAGSRSSWPSTWRSACTTTSTGPPRCTARPSPGAGRRRTACRSPTGSASASRWAPPWSSPCCPGVALGALTLRRALPRLARTALARLDRARRGTPPYPPRVGTGARGDVTRDRTTGPRSNSTCTGTDRRTR